jgi:hypothetical protein
MPRISPRRALVLLLWLVAACSGGDTPTAPRAVPPGVLSLTVAGLPTGVSADVSVSGLTFSRTATGSVTWTDVPAGVHTITVRPVRTTDGTFAATPSVVSVTVVSGSTPSATTITYQALPSAIDLILLGVPAGVDAPVTVSPPSGGEVAAATSRVLTSANSGRWRVAAGPLLTGGFRYTPTPASIDTLVQHGDTARVAVRYDVSSGAIAVAVTGLPAGRPGAVQVTGPDGFSRSVTATATLTDLVPGAYRVVAATVAANGITFRPTPDTLTVTVRASVVAAPAAVVYAAQVGRVVLTTSGVPADAAPVLTLTGNGLTRALSGAATLDSLPVGSYTVSAVPLTVAGVRYAPAPREQSVTISTGATTTVTVAFAVVPTVVDIPVTGLPAGTPANITLLSPSGEAVAVTGTTRISPAVAGRWRLSAVSVSGGGATYLPTPTARDTTVSAGDTLSLPVHYAITTGAIAVVVSGLPSGASGSVAVTGPGGFSRTLTATTTLTLLAPGSYTVSAASVGTGATTYVPVPVSQQVTVVASLVASPATVSYALATGAVTIATSGIPGSATPTFALSGTGAPRSVSGAGTVSALEVGSWTITANTIVSGATTYTPTPASQSVTITPNGTATATFAYAATVAQNYAISTAYVTQAIQRFDGTVALVAGREALLRVFVQASAANSARPDVRVRLYDGATLLQSTLIPAPEAGVRTVLAEGTLTSTWNLIIPGVNIRPTTRVLIELDPALAVTDADRSDNIWPRSGTPQVLRVNSVPTFTVRLVPVVAGGRTGNVTAANKGAFLASVQKMFPLNTIVSDVRAPFTASATDIQSNDDNGQWLTVLSELNALRATDGAPSAMHYYGVLGVSYTSGIAGYGYAPGRAAVGWDLLPSGDEVAAHEWGHNFSRNHAPCGTTGDTNFPYSGGTIGHWGWNSALNTLVPPTWTDVMGYCNNQWVSDYTWSAIMQYRSTAASVVASAYATDAPRDGLLVWGRITNGRVQLEPAFRVPAPASAAVPSAAIRLELLDADGAILLDTPIEAPAVDHAAATDERQFAVVVPWSAALEDRLATIRVRDTRSPLSAIGQRRTRLVAPVAGATPVAPAVQAQVERTADGQSRVTWNSAAYPMAMVRDAATGALMGFVRRSGDTVVTGGRAVEVVVSDGVRTVRR